MRFVNPEEEGAVRLRERFGAGGSRLHYPRFACQFQAAVGPSPGPLGNRFLALSVTWDVPRQHKNPSILSNMSNRPNLNFRWLKYTLLLLLFVGIWMAWDVGKMALRLRRQREAVATIRSSGGGVSYGYEKGHLPPPEPYWLQGLLRPDVVHPVAKASLHGPNGTDAVVEAINGLPEIRSVSLIKTQVTDAGLKHLKALTQLQELYIDEAPITGVGLESLDRLTHLTWLWLDRVPIADEGLKYLGGLTNLASLCLSGTQVRGVGLEHLSGLTQLRTLDLSNTPVNDTGLAQIEALTSLRQIRLENTQITDAGLAHLAALRQLEVLSLRGTKVTWEGLKKLKAALPGLIIGN